MGYSFSSFDFWWTLIQHRDISFHLCLSEIGANLSSCYVYSILLALIALFLLRADQLFLLVCAFVRCILTLNFSDSLRQWQDSCFQLPRSGLPRTQARVRRALVLCVQRALVASPGWRPRPNQRGGPRRHHDSVEGPKCAGELRTRAGGAGGSLPPTHGLHQALEP